MTTNKLSIFRFCNQYITVLCTSLALPGRWRCDGFAYAIDFKDGGYVLNITNAAAILARNEVTGKIEFDLNRCPPLCPNLPYAEINVTIPIADGRHHGTEPAIMRMQSGPKEDLWIREDGPNHR